MISQVLASNQLEKSENLTRKWSWRETRCLERVWNHLSFVPSGLEEGPRIIPHSPIGQLDEVKESWMISQVSASNQLKKSINLARKWSWRETGCLERVWTHLQLVANGCESG